MKNILVYVDEGVSPRSLKALLTSLKEENIAPERIHKTNREQLIGSSWEEKTSLLIFPGGRDVPYHNALKGAGNKKMRSFVENGGAFLGLCAGAYFGASFIEFEKGGALEVIASRELAFFPGKAEGPAYGNGTFSYEDESGARLAELDWEGEKVFSYYNGGCLFANAANSSHTKVVAAYTNIENAPAAIIECQVNEGRAVLCGVHPEYSSEFLTLSSDPKLQTLGSCLLEKEDKRRLLFKHLLCELISL